MHLHNTSQPGITQEEEMHSHRTSQRDTGSELLIWLVHHDSSQGRMQLAGTGSRSSFPLHTGFGQWISTGNISHLNTGHTRHSQ
jgi:hypothetical protein